MEQTYLILIRRNVVPEQVEIRFLAIKVLYGKFIQVEASAKRHGKNAFVQADAGFLPSEIKGLFQVAGGMVLPFIVVVFGGDDVIQWRESKHQLFFCLSKTAYPHFMNGSFVEVKASDAIEIL